LKKLTYEFVKEKIEKEGYELLSTEYVGARSKLNIRCLVGHEYTVAYNSFKSGHRCPFCSDHGKISYEQVKYSIEKDGYVILTDKYVNCKTKIMVQCSSGHQYNTTFDNFSSGYRCKQCGIKKNSDIKRHSVDFLLEIIRKSDVRLISDVGEYVNNNTRMIFECASGHIYNSTMASFIKGCRCKTCFHIRFANDRKLDYNTVKDEFISHGYELLSDEYYSSSSSSKLLVRCPVGHEYSVGYGNFKSGQRCPECLKYLVTSKPEKDIVNYVNLLTTEKVIENDRKTIRNNKTRRFLELDIWIPTLNKAIEFNGKYWHSFRDVIENDIIKKKQCIEIGIDLLVIDEIDWVNDKLWCLDSVKKHIKGNINEYC